MISHIRFRTDVPIATLADVVVFWDSKRKPITESERVSGPYPYYGANGIQDHVADWIFDEELVLLAEDGGHFENPDRGVAYKISGKSWVNNHAHVLRPTNQVHIDYLNHVLKNMDLMPYITGSTRLKLNKSSAERIKIPLPPLAEQQRIAAILDKAEEIKRKRLQAIAKLDELAQSTFVEMFGDPVAINSKFSKSLLSNVCIKITDGTHHSPLIQNAGVPYITAKHLKEDGLDFYAKPWFISQSAHDEIYKRCDPKKGDVLYIKDGATTGIAAINHYDFAFSMLSSLALIRTNIERINPYYLCYWLNNSKVKEQLLGFMSGAAIQRLTLAKIKAITLPIPKISLQNQFAEFIKNIETQRKRMLEHHEKSTLLIKSLQHQAFSTGFRA